MTLQQLDLVTRKQQASKMCLEINARGQWINSPRIHGPSVLVKYYEPSGLGLLKQIFYAM